MRCSLYSRQRPKEILDWLAGYKEPVASWCAIDDRQLIQEQGGYPGLVGHFVLTNNANLCVDAVRNNLQVNTRSVAKSVSSSNSTKSSRKG